MILIKFPYIIYRWVNYNSSQTWIQATIHFKKGASPNAISGWFSLLIMIPGLGRSEVVIIYPYIYIYTVYHIYIYTYTVYRLYNYIYIYNIKCIYIYISYHYHYYYYYYLYRYRYSHISSKFLVRFEPPHGSHGCSKPPPIAMARLGHWLAHWVHWKFIGRP